MALEHVFVIFLFLFFFEDSFYDKDPDFICCFSCSADAEAKFAEKHDFVSFLQKVVFMSNKCAGSHHSLPNHAASANSMNLICRST